MLVSGIHDTYLTVIVVGCQKLKKKSWGTALYVVLEYNGIKYQTKICKGDGINPIFDEKFVLSLVEGVQEINVYVWNKNNISMDTFIGRGKIQLLKVLSEGYDDIPWMLEGNSTSYAGEVHVVMQYKEAEKAKAQESKKQLEASESLYPRISLGQLLSAPAPVPVPLQVAPAAPIPAQAQAEAPHLPQMLPSYYTHQYYPTPFPHPNSYVQSYFPPPTSSNVYDYYMYPPSPSPYDPHLCLPQYESSYANPTPQHSHQPNYKPYTRTSFMNSQVTHNEHQEYAPPSSSTKNSHQVYEQYETHHEEYAPHYYSGINHGKDAQHGMCKEYKYGSSTMKPHVNEEGQCAKCLEYEMQYHEIMHWEHVNLKESKYQPSAPSLPEGDTHDNIIPTSDTSNPRIKRNKIPECESS